MKYFEFSVSPESISDYDQKLLNAVGLCPTHLIMSAEAAPVMTEKLAQLLMTLEAQKPPKDRN